jgi:hypothetical protein
MMQKGKGEQRRLSVKGVPFMVPSTDVEHRQTKLRVIREPIVPDDRGTGIFPRPRRLVKEMAYDDSAE